MLLVGGRSPSKILYAKDTGRVMQTDFMPVYNEKALLEKVEQVRGGKGGRGRGEGEGGSGERQEGEGRGRAEGRGRGLITCALYCTR